jgi:predicted Zn-dependent protease
MTVVSTVPSVFAEIGRLRQLHAAGRHAEVLAAGRALVRDVPENRDLLLLVATSERVTGDIAAATATLDRLETLHPRFSRMLQERGLCFIAQKDAPRAIDALLRAVNINPALPMSWQMLVGVYRLAGDPANAAIAAEHVAALAALRPAVVTATSLFADGDLAPAEEMVRGVLRQYGDDVEAMRLLAKVGMAREVFDDAELLFDAVLARVPGHRAARHEYTRQRRRRSRRCSRPTRATPRIARSPRPQRSASATTRGRSSFIARCSPTSRIRPT